MPKRVEALLRRSTFFVQPTIRTKLSCYLIKTGHLFPQQRKIIFSHRDGAWLYGREVVFVYFVRSGAGRHIAMLSVWTANTTA